jgi:hypothetical protein
MKQLFSMLLILFSATMFSQDYLLNSQTGNYNLGIFSDDTHLMVTASLRAQEAEKKQERVYVKERNSRTGKMEYKLLTIGKSSESLQKSQSVYVHYLIMTDNINQQSMNMYLLRNMMLRTDNKL